MIPRCTVSGHAAPLEEVASHRTNCVEGGYRWYRVVYRCPECRVEFTDYERRKEVSLTERLQIIADAYQRAVKRFQERHERKVS